MYISIPILLLLLWLFSIDDEIKEVRKQLAPKPDPDDRRRMRNGVLFYR